MSQTMQIKEEPNPDLNTLFQVLDDLAALGRERRLAREFHKKQTHPTQVKGQHDQALKH